MQDMKIAYEARGMNNYLSIQLEAEVNDYQLKMMEKNSIPGLLAVSGKMLNGVYCLNYEITRMKRLKDAINIGYLQGNAAKNFFLEIMRSMMQIEEYFLVFGNCLFESEYIFVDERQKPRMVYVPVRGMEITNAETVRSFYRELAADYLRYRKEPFFMDLLVYVSGSDFSLPGLLKMLEEGADNAEEKIENNGSDKAVGVKTDPIYGRTGGGTGNGGVMDGGIRGAIEEISAGTENGTGGIAIPDVNTSGESTNGKREKKKRGFFGGLLKGDKQENELEERAEKKNKQEKGFERPEEREKNLSRKLFSEKKTKEQLGSDTESVSEFQQEQPENVHAQPDTNTPNNPKVIETVMIGANSSPYLQHQGKKIALKKFPFVIGQIYGDYLIPNPAVSRTHASIIVKDGCYYIQDENSSNHTYINGNQIAPYTEVEIHEGDILKLADEEMSFRVR